MSEVIYTTSVDSKVIEVVHTRVQIGDDGPGKTPRVASVYHAPDGKLLAVYDPNVGPSGAVIESGNFRSFREKISSRNYESIVKAYLERPERRNSSVMRGSLGLVRRIDTETIHVIHTRAVVGEIVPGDMLRVVHIYHAIDGALLACYDPYIGAVDDEIQSETATAAIANVVRDIDSIDIGYTPPLHTDSQAA
ncbi:hypothetical protein PQQ99_20125 [Paraburkholderia sediminicola]|uniref:hypothetical protein n=1 Tax=Paraburkholderia sediminicola TaxID=458836 RepID=UPI0038BCB2FA